MTAALVPTIASRRPRTDQTTAPHAITGRGELTVALAAMRMTNRAGQRVSRVRAGVSRQSQHALDHILHLLLGSVTITHHRLLDLQRGVFAHH